MSKYNSEELQEAKKAIASTLGKCEKAFEKLQEGTSQYTLMERRVAAFRIALGLIEEEMNK